MKKTTTIELYCRNSNLPFVGKIPFDSMAVQAINNGQSIVDIDCIAGQAVKEVYKETIKILLYNN